MGVAAIKYAPTRRTLQNVCENFFDLEFETLEERIEDLEARALDAPLQASIFVVEELERSDLDLAWRDALISAAEQLQLDDENLRARLASSLLRHAQSMDRSIDTPVLWSALRRYASLSSGEDVLVNIPAFLAPSSARTTQQAALQALENTFSAHGPKITPPAIARRIEEIATAAIPGKTAADRALALSAIVTAACLELPNAMTMIRSVAPEDAETLRRFLLRELTRIAALRKTQGGVVAALVAELQK